jgi:hypothetical protein
MEEIKKFLFEMGVNRAPGPYNIPIKFTSTAGTL